MPFRGRRVTLDAYCLQYMGCQQSNFSKHQYACMINQNFLFSGHFIMINRVRVHICPHFQCKLCPWLCGTWGDTGSHLMPFTTSFLSTCTSAPRVGNITLGFTVIRLAQPITVQYLDLCISVMWEYNVWGIMVWVYYTVRSLSCINTRKNCTNFKGNNNKVCQNHCCN